MDPRLNPNLTPQHQNTAVPTPHPATPQPAVHSQYSSQPAPARPVPAVHTPLATHPNSVEQPMVPQVVEAFPVKQQAASTAQPQAPTPAPPLPAQSSNPIERSEDDLDKILQAVNNRVKTPEKPADSKKKELGKKVLSKTSKIKDKAKSPKPIGPMVVVLMISLMLSATAILAYREGNRTAVTSKAAGKVGTSYTASSAIQEAGGTLVNPGDLDNYAQTLQSKLNSLNDSQDFTANSLSDKVLGL